MQTLIDVVMIGAPVVVLIAFFFFPTQRVIFVASLLLWLFLPVHTYDLPGLPDVDKSWVIGVVAVMGVLGFDRQRLQRFQWHWADALMAAWIVLPIFSSMHNASGIPANALYDGVTSSMTQGVEWAIPYAIGRLYLRDLSSLQELCYVFLAAMCLYLPFILFESLTTPRLHEIVYGFLHYPFEQSIRFGGYRPTVFMRHGLMLAFWVAATALLSSWLAVHAKKQTSLQRVLILLAVVFAGLVVLMRSINGWGWFVGGLALFVLTVLTQKRIVMYAAIAFVPIYIGMQMMGLFPNEVGVELAVQFFGPDRAQSLSYRLENEALLMQRAMARPLFGWAGWNRQHVFDAWGNVVTVADSTWIITLGRYGVLGLMAQFSAILVPVYLAIRHTPISDWRKYPQGLTVVMAILLLLFAYDNLLNEMYTPLYAIWAGGLIALIRPSDIRI